MAELGEWWLNGGSGHERRLREDIDSLGVDLFAGGGRSAAPAARWDEAQGTLSSRVERMSSALDALVELVDVRAQLAGYAPAAMVRLAARRHLAALSRARAGGGPAADPPPVEDVPGYWLAPALAALDDLAAGGDGGGAGVEALRRDGLRSALFWALAAGDRLVGPAATPAVERLLPERAGDAISRAGRLLWVAAAEGRLGIDLRLAVARHLDRLITHLDVSEASALRAEWVTALNALALPAPVEIPAPLTTDAADPLVAAARLAILASWCAPPPAAAAWTPPPPPPHQRPAAHDPAPAAGRAQVGAPRAPDEPEPSVLLLHAPPAPPPEPTEPRAADGVAELLRYLVEEGSPPEINLLRRDIRLRDLARGLTPQPPRALEDRVGVVAGLLRRDAFGDAPAQRAVALWVGRQWVIEAAERLLVAARAVPVSSVEVRVDGARLTVREGGPRPDELTVAVKMAAEETVPDSGSYNPLTRRRQGHDREQFEADLRSRLAAAADRATKVLAEHRTRCQSAVEEASASVATIRRAFGMETSGR